MIALPRQAAYPVPCLLYTSLVVVTTPGHTSDSVSFLLPAECAVLTGDTILGRGTTVVAWPDGELAAYLASLERLEALCGSGAVARILPGHGPHLPDAGAVLRYYLCLLYTSRCV